MEQITNMQASYQTLYFSQVMMQDDAAHPGYLCRAEELMDTIKTIDYHHARRYTTTHSTHHTPPTTLVMYEYAMGDHTLQQRELES